MNITLIGMAGVGKSVLGKELAKRLNYKFLDIDRIIEKKTKLKLQQIIDEFGEDEFLELEEKVVLELGDFDKYIISSGGSIVYSEEAMKKLKKSSAVVFLKTPFENIQKILVDKNTRGIIGLKKKSLKTLFNERMILCKKYADLTIEIPKDFDIDDVISNIIQKITY